MFRQVDLHYPLWLISANQIIPQTRVRDGYEIAELIFPKESPPPHKSHPRPSIFIFHHRCEKCRTTYLAVRLTAAGIARSNVAFSAGINLADREWDVLVPDSPVSGLDETNSAKLPHSAVVSRVRHDAPREQKRPEGETEVYEGVAKGANNERSAHARARAFFLSQAGSHRRWEPFPGP